jgi:hypothetical protein
LGTAIFILSELIPNYAPWLALSILVRRIGFNYYMIYTLPFVALAAAFFWRQLPPRYGKLGLALNLIAAGLFSQPFYPTPAGGAFSRNRQNTVRTYKGTGANSSRPP